MFGIPDPVIWMGYLLTLLSVAACVIFSVKNWNKSDVVVPENQEQDMEWEKQDDELKEML